MGLKSRLKGKVGERSGAEFLRSIGFTRARRTQQYNGEGKSDLVIEDMPELHVECKFGYPAAQMCPGSALWWKAVLQAKSDAAGKPWILLYRPLRWSGWLISYEENGRLMTTLEAEAIKDRILMLVRDWRADNDGWSAHA